MSKLPFLLQPVVELENWTVFLFQYEDETTYHFSGVDKKTEMSLVSLPLYSINYLDRYGFSLNEKKYVLTGYPTSDRAIIDYWLNTFNNSGYIIKDITNEFV
jgi:hypothetical protein